MHLACVLMRMSMSEALAAATLNSAYSLGKSATHGSLEVGKVADMVVVDAPRFETVAWVFFRLAMRCVCIVYAFDDYADSKTVISLY